jgi:putative ABC transport system substrate-binding protein
LKRRTFITLLGGAAGVPFALWPLAARAQQPNAMRRIAVLTGFGEDDPESKTWIAAFMQGLEKLGWVLGRNLQVHNRFAAGDMSRLVAYAAELVALAPEVLLVHGSPAMLAATRATQTIPIVFINVADPVGSGFVPNLARPGGNVTGFLNIEPSIGSKWLELLRQMAPGMTQAAVLNDPTNPSTTAFLSAIEAAGPSFRIGIVTTNVRAPDDIERTIAATTRSGSSGLIVLPSAILAANRAQIIELTARHRLPAIYPFRYYAADGGLVSYGIDVVDLYRRAPDYIDRILRGERPGDLPVQAPVKFEFVLNLKTAKALGLTVPETLLVTADEVIE